MKFLVIGGSGLIGWKLVQLFIQEGNDVEFTFLTNKTQLLVRSHQIDITQNNVTAELLKKINPDIVFHTAALTNVDLCETNKQMADTINVNGTKNIIEGCKVTKSKLVFLSTCFVFDGKKQQYFEEDKPSPSTYYGLTKFKGEELVKNSGLDYLILRTDQPYCWIQKWQHTNSVLRVLNTLQSGKILNEIVDWHNTPTYVPDFVHATKKLIDKNSIGVFNVVGSDFVNRYEWALKVAKIFELNQNNIKPVHSDTLNLSAKRVNVNLSNEKLFQKTGIHMKGIIEGLTEMRKDSQAENTNDF